MRILQKTPRKGWVGLAALLLVAIAWPAPALIRSLAPSRASTGGSGSGSTAGAGQADPPPAELVRLPAGKRFDDQHPPLGWSHLILRSTPFLESGDLDTLSKAAFETAKRIRFTIVANVVRTSNGRGYRLDRVGVGLSTPAATGGGEVIVTPSDVDGSQGSWSVTERIILAAGSFELSRGDLIAATPTFAVARLSTTALVKGAHEKVHLIYAFVVDPISGRLRTFHWWELDDGPAKTFTEFEHPNVLESPLHVQASRLAGIVVAWSFAMLHAPEGIERPVPPNLARLIAPASIASIDPKTLEAALIAAAAEPPPASGGR